jgi:hypothetical protein
MNAEDCYKPSETQMRSAVQGDDRYFNRRRVLWFKIALAVVFFGLLTFVFLFGLMSWRWK